MTTFDFEKLLAAKAAADAAYSEAARAAYLAADARAAALDAATRAAAAARDAYE